MGMKLRNFELPMKLAFEEGSYSPTYGKIVVEPFEKGYGITVGNSLRRILLSSIEGTAVTRVKIDRVHHEFSSIEGVLEDVPEILMNLKGLVFRSHFKASKSLFISAKKKGVVTAADIKADDTIEVINPDHHIATLTDDVEFDMELVVERGRGYMPSELNKKEDLPIGHMAIDSLFSPVKRVNLDVMETRVGHITDYDKLELEIFTNGSMEPKEALLYAANILQRHLDVFLTVGTLPEDLEEEEEEEKDREEMRSKLNKPISELELSVRSSNCLAEANIRTIGDLVMRKETEMLKYKNFGKKSLTEINNILQTMGLHLGMDVDEE